MPDGADVRCDPVKQYRPNRAANAVKRDKASHAAFVSAAAKGKRPQTFFRLAESLFAFGFDDPNTVVLYLFFAHFAIPFPVLLSYPNSSFDFLQQKRSVRLFFAAEFRPISTLFFIFQMLALQSAFSLCRRRLWQENGKIG
mgnify:CR=1 FL=1